MANDNISITPGSDIFDNNNKLKFNTDSADIQELMYSNGIYDKYKMGLFDRFSRIQSIDPYNTIKTVKEYIFITKPDLYLLDSSGNIQQSLQNNALFVDAASRYKPVILQLQSSANRDGNPFMTLLSNSVTTSLNIPGISADSIETATNIVGTRISYRGTSIKSDQDLDFDLEFEETKYLDIYMLFKIYDEYERLKWNGTIDLAANDHWKNYIFNKVLHDQMTIYKFLVDEDGMRILYWARITGCYPTSVPRESFTELNPVQRYSVSWKGNFIRDMDPIILYQFNILVYNLLKKYTTDLSIYNTSTHAVNGRWAGTPWIYERLTRNNKHKNLVDPTTERVEYFLRWNI